VCCGQSHNSSALLVDVLPFYHWWFMGLMVGLGVGLLYD
jgi:hypothetical protein